MSKQANKTLIGGFVVGATALIIAGVLIFGSGQFFIETRRYVVCFEESVQGLNIGAPVVFRGVKIGTVTDILLRADPASKSIDIPVYMEVEPHRFQTVGKDQLKLDPERNYKVLVEELGMRARLQSASMVTGQLMVELDFHPNTPIKLKGLDDVVLEIPTIPSPLKALSKAIAQLPVEEIFNRLLSAIEGIEGVVNSPEVLESIRSLNQALKEGEKLLKDVDGQIAPLVSRIDGTMRDTQKLVRSIEKRIGPLQAGIEDTSKKAAAAITQAEETLESIERITAEDSAVVHELINALEELSASARSMRSFTDYLQRHPEALLHGKGGTGGR
jgi:paraquat-inducible protein B